MFINSKQLSTKIKQIGYELGFNSVAISSPSLVKYEATFERWLKLRNEGEMGYLQRHNLKRTNITQIFDPTISVISVGLNYLTQNISNAIEELNDNKPNISLYARNLDYHKLMRKKLKFFAQEIEKLISEELSEMGLKLKARPFVDSAPILEKAFARKSGIGWSGKHTNIINKDKGSFFFLGELAINLKLVADSPVENHCGSCTKCIDICPTNAIIAPYILDTQKCISYLTIEYKGIIPDKLKQQIGNRIFGCDDCQLYCPWNKYSKQTKTDLFSVRQQLDNQSFLQLFSWSEQDFIKNVSRSPIKRIGYDIWHRNLAIAIGNYFRKYKEPNSANISQNDTRLLELLKKTQTNNSATKNAIYWALSKISE